MVVPASKNNANNIRFNENIKQESVQLIDAEGNNLGVMETAKAIELAQEQDLDLVEVSLNNGVSVCRLLDYGKFRYEQQKRIHTQRKHNRSTGMKEIKFRPNIEDHDYQTKLRFIKKFLDGGDRVKITLRFRGRELSHQHLGQQLMGRISTDLAEDIRVESPPFMEGRQIVMIIAPR